VIFCKIMAELIKVFIDTPQLRVIKKAVECIKDGGIIVYPTDTIYGLAADLYNKRAMEKIQRIKGSKNKLLSFILPDLRDISVYANVPDYAYKSMRRVTPGPYTFVLNATKEVPRLLLYNRKTVGIRIPDAPFALKLLEELGNPLLSTSVPYGDNGYHTDPNEIQLKYDNEIDLILDAGIMFNNPSTIVDFTGESVSILREGAGDISALNY